MARGKGKERGKERGKGKERGIEMTKKVKCICCGKLLWSGGFAIEGWGSWKWVGTGKDKRLKEMGSVCDECHDKDSEEGCSTQQKG